MVIIESTPKTKGPSPYFVNISPPFGPIGGSKEKPKIKTKETPQTKKK